MNAKSDIRWYVIYTNIKCEYRAQGGLEGKGFLTFLPTYRIRLVKNRMKTEITRILFPRYLFVGVREGQPCGDIRQTDGVEAVLRNQGEWVEVPEQVIARLMKADDDREFDPKELPPLPPNTMVKVKGEGPFAGLVGKIKEAAPGYRMRVLLELFGRETIAQIALADLEKVA